MARSASLSGAWLGLAVALTTATQLRPGVPVGPGELMLVAWIVATALSLLAQNRVQVSRTGRLFLAFWVGALVLLLAGWLTGLLIDRAALSAPRDFLAYVLASTLVLLLLFKPGGAEEVRVAGPVAIFAATLAFVLLLVATFPGGTLGPVEPWFFFRFRGWSENPNQVALAMCVVPFLALHGLTGSRRTAGRAAYLVLLPLSVVVGAASASDGLLLGWVAGLAVMAGHAWILALLRGRASYGRGVVIYVLLPLVAVAGLAVGGRAVYLRAQAALEGIYAAGDQGSVRVMLWRHALQATAESPILGLGPGGHSGWDGPFGEMEAHNLMIDWGSATGLAGSVLLLGLLAVVVWRVLRRPSLLAAVTALVVFGISGFHLRHPVFWLYLVLIVVLAETAAEPEPQRPGGELAPGSGSSPSRA